MKTHRYNPDYRRLSNRHEQHQNTPPRSANSFDDDYYEPNHEAPNAQIAASSYDRAYDWWNRGGGQGTENFTRHGRIDQVNEDFIRQGNYMRPEEHRRRNETTGDLWPESQETSTTNRPAEHFRQSHAMQGTHRGKGPLNYVRSDERIKEDINDRLYDDSFVDASDIAVNVTAGEVVLTGTVDSRQVKRHVDDICDSISGVKNIENRLRVTQPAEFQNGSQGGFGGGISGTARL